MDINILKKINLLYVEDDESIRNVLVRGIQRRVLNLEVAVDGEDGFEKYKSFKPDIIVTDIKMPKMSGLEMSRKIREKDLSTPIIITSAHGESETLLEAIDIGVNGYILKPIDKDKLFNTITMFAKSIVLERELEQKNKQLMIKSKNASLGELIQNISHQWRQPLSLISTTASTMQLKNEMGILELESIDKFTTDIVNTAQYLSDTIDMFRDNFVSTDEFKVQFKLVDIFKNIQTMLQSKLDDFNIKIILDINENIEIESLKKLFSQAILNLILNSIDKFEESDIEEKYIFIDRKSVV